MDSVTFARNASRPRRLLCAMPVLQFEATRVNREPDVECHGVYIITQRQADDSWDGIVPRDQRFDCWSGSQMFSRRKKS